MTFTLNVIVHPSYTMLTKTANLGFAHHGVGDTVTASDGDFLRFL